MNKKNTTLRQMAAATLAALGVFGTALSQAGTTTSFTYDAVGQVTSVTSPSGRTKSLQWDAFGRNVSQSVNGASTGYGYNYQNALTAVQDPKGLTTSYDRNGFGEARSQTSPDTGTSNYSYDANGNLTSRVNAAGQVESYTYDAADRVVTKTVSHPAGGSLTYRFSYGTTGVEAGRLVQISAPGLTLTYSHNILGEVTSASQAISGSRTLTTSYGYAANGALTSITYPSGRVVSFGLDSASRPSSMTSGSTNLLTGIGYTPLGAIAGWTFGSGQAVARTFDGAGRVASVTMPWGARTYSYDNEDRIVGITDGALGSATYGYDGFDRLTSATTALGAWAYGYDANGNRTSNSVNGLGYGVAVDSSSNRVNGYINQAGFARVVDYTPDGHAAQVGSGTPQPSCGSSVTFGYQADGQLATSNVLTAIHAPNGLRLQKTAAACAGGAKTNFVYDPAGHLIGEYDTTGAPIQETAWLGDLPVAVFKNFGGTVTNFNVYADNLGSPRAITSTSGQVVWGWDGEPFGATPANQNPNNLGDFVYGLRFPGQYFDVETGYHHNGWREYEPSLGRYLQSDPLGLAGGFNTYEYAFSSPLTIADPSGRCGVFLPACAMAGGFVVGTLGHAAIQYFATGTVDWKEAATTGAELASVFMFTKVGGAAEAEAVTTSNMQALTAAEARTVVGGANCPRTGPVGVVPNRHNANATVRDANGNIVGHQRFVSGNMTPEEAALPGGFRARTNATHTEARATTQMEIPEGGTMTITGQKEPCTSCRGYMNRAAYSSDATIKYQWREDGQTKTWTTKK